MELNYKQGENNCEVKAENRAKEGRAEGPLVLSAKQDRGPDRRREDQDSNLPIQKKVQNLWASTPRTRSERGEGHPFRKAGHSETQIRMLRFTHHRTRIAHTTFIIAPLFETEVSRCLSFRSAQLLAQTLTLRQS